MQATPDNTPSRLTQAAQLLTDPPADPPESDTINLWQEAIECAATPNRSITT